MFTGLYPSWHGAHRTSAHGIIGRPLSNDALTMAELLREKGYSTMATVANSYYVRPNFGLDQGFAVFDYRKPVLAITYRGKRYLLRNTFCRVLGRYMSTVDWYSETRNSYEINGAALALLERARNERTSFFLFTNYMDAHDPYSPSSPYDTMFNGRNPRFSYPGYMTKARDVFRLEKTLPEDVRRHLVSQYDGGIAQAGHAIGEVVAKLRQMGVYDNTLLITQRITGKLSAKNSYYVMGTVSCTMS